MFLIYWCVFRLEKDQDSRERYVVENVILWTRPKPRLVATEPMGSGVDGMQPKAESEVPVSCVAHQLAVTGLGGCPSAAGPPKTSSPRLRGQVPILRQPPGLTLLAVYLRGGAACPGSSSPVPLHLGPIAPLYCASRLTSNWPISSPILRQQRPHSRSHRAIGAVACHHHSRRSPLTEFCLFTSPTTPSPSALLPALFHPPA